ncbi:hypothetical protein D6C78_07261 [Aureobasidium pullulans]|uniref:Uncharacterized protein n=1 Tax=Aureobasidium pullulans TaxID=5580 RepID=A0A4T0BHK6_AURPU|nr:hypothetical protein D6C78_07261 [Aureobasidium pullulans]
MYSSLAIIALSLAVLVAAQNGVVNPLVEGCGPSNNASNASSVACVNRYAAVMPYHFFRSSSYNTTDYPFASTSVPNDTSFGRLNSSDFFVYDGAQGLPLLGDNPTCEKMFGDQVTMAVHKAPVYVPGINKLFVGVLEQGYLPQLVVDLNQDPHALSEF